MSSPGSNQERCSRVRVSPRRIFDFADARAMLPLVRRIVDEWIEAAARQRRLERQRDELADSKNWDDRRRQFAIADDLAHATSDCRRLRGELRQLGGMLFRNRIGQVAFPSIVNGSLAFFVYLPDDQDIYHWRYRDQPKLRSIPETWYAESEKTAQKPIEVVLDPLYT